MIQRLYRCATEWGEPLIELYLRRRMTRGKEDPVRFPERKGEASAPRPQGPLIWLHGASVGEAQALLPLIDRLSQTNRASLLLTTGTVTSASLLADRLPVNAIHQFIPVDRPDWVAKFLDHWRPQLALWSESDFWPNLLEETARRRIPMVLLQGRISPNSYSQWRRVPRFIGHILGHFDLCLAQSQGDSDRLIKLGAKSVGYEGNLKLAVPPLPADPGEVERLSAQVADRPVWVAASTHPGEEAACARVHAALKSRFPDLLTLVIPRHPPRARAVAAEIASMGLTVGLRSENNPLTGQSDIYVVDTIGELGLFFRLSPLVFMGKSLCAEGGQNPFEPARLGAAVLFGPRMSNFIEMSGAMLAANAAVEVRDEDDLRRRVDQLLSDGKALDRLRRAALTWAMSEADILDRFLDRLSPFLDNLDEIP